MTKKMETLIVEAAPRALRRHDHFRLRADTRLSGYFPEARYDSKQQESKPRFRINSIAPSNRRDPLKSPMRVLLRNAETMKFLGSGDRWTSNPKEARDFHNGWWATVHAFAKNPRHLVIHYEFDDERYNLSIAVLGHRKI